MRPPLQPPPFRKQMTRDRIAKGDATNHRRDIMADTHLPPQQGPEPARTDANKIAGAVAETTARSLGGARWGDAVHETFVEAARKNLSHIAAGVAFYMLFSIFPAIAVAISVAGLVSDPAYLLELVDQLAGLLPPDAFDLIRGQVENTLKAGGLALGSTAVISALLAFWSAGGAVRALMSAMSLAFPETWAFGVVGHFLLSLVFTLLGILLIVGLMLLVVALPILFQAIQHVPEMLGLPQDLGVGIDLGWVALLEWPILFGVGVIVSTALYRAGAARGPRAWGGAFRGALIATISWIVASKLLIFYVTEYGDLAKTYGPLGTVAGLMLWFWISAFVLLLGAELARTLSR